MRFFRCTRCNNVFSEDEMTRSDQRDGCCPQCGVDGAREIDPSSLLSLNHRRKKAYTAPYKPSIDWDAVRRAKISCCRTCQLYDRSNLGCKLWLLPSMNCKNRKATRVDKRNSA